MKYYQTLTLILLLQTGYAQVFPVTNIIDNGLEAEHLNFVVLPDGYTSGELATFNTDAQSISTNIFAKSPFLEYANFFNVFIIEVPSNESGIDHPGTATDVVEPQFPIVDVDNYFGTTFDYYDIHRLLVPTDNLAINSVIATNYPSADQVIVLANSPQYGGAGGSLATTSLHSAAAEIAIHEIGHSFGGLSDEYWAGSTFAQENENMTATSDPSSVLWNDWVGTNNVGVFSYDNGSDPASANWYRPHQTCEMRFLNQEFCSVCKETFIDQIYSMVDPIETKTPEDASIHYTGPPLDFELDLILPSPNTLKLDWILNGSSFAVGVDSIQLDGIDLTLSTNTLTVTVTDTTLLSKTYSPSAGYTFMTSWAISNDVLPLDLLDFSVKDEDISIALNWQTANEFNISHFDVEKSKDGLNFSRIESINPLGENNINNYETMDHNPIDGNNYYRLKIVDRDDSFTYSPVRLVSRVSKFFFKIFPNPTTDKIFIHHKQTATAENLEIKIYNALGQLVKTASISNNIGENNASVDVRDLANGIYFLAIERNGRIEKMTFTKS